MLEVLEAAYLVGVLTIPSLFTMLIGGETGHEENTNSGHQYFYYLNILRIA
jgi:hypothetical protein